MVTRGRTKKLTILLADGELAMVREIAARQGLTVSDVVRQLIRLAHQTGK